ncbi:hypothetical protein RvY_14309-1 [Ramazzottius varieornatus]|uniref:G-protein coupled receptors family 1 profile domain-containing protein n=1 Tax=Ramazzottius varieornatus TaxID=947166 RepID=A0A1D1VUR1_RAMVA|nr:hypothetical protein RvY_14309-1 [Ramazzottius varieornatus]
MWIIVHLLEVPVVTIGRMYSRPNDTSRSCILHVDRYRDLALASQIIGFILPEVLVIISGPIIMLKIRHRHFNRVAHLPALNKNPNMGVHQSTPVINDDVDCSNDPHRLQLPCGRRNSSSGVQDIAADISVLKTPSVLDPELRERSSLRKSSRANSHDRVLAYLVIAVIICWTPNHVYFTLNRINGFWNAMYYAIQYCVFYANSWINPMICYFALPKFRSAINKLFGCPKTKPFTMK